MTDIFREVDEDLRHEQFAKLWRRYGSYVIGAAVVVVVATAAIVGWREYSVRRQISDSNKYAVAMTLAKSAETQGAVEAFAAVAEEAADGYAMLARFSEAALRADQGDLAGAVAIYDRIAESGTDPVFRDLAVLLSATYSLENADPEGLSARIEPLTAADNPWRYSALELTGLLALRTGDTAQAREIFTRLAQDPTAPAGIRSRAGEMLQTQGG